MKIKINSVAPAEKGNEDVCNGFYPVGSLQEIFIEKGEKEARPYIQAGRVIREKVVSGFEKHFEFGDGSSTKKEEELPSCYKDFLEMQKRFEAERKEAAKKPKEEQKPNFFLEIVDVGGNALTGMTGMLYKSDFPDEVVLSGYLDKLAYGMNFKPGTYDIIIEKGLIVKGVAIEEGKPLKKTVTYDHAPVYIAKDINFQIEVLTPDKRPVETFYHLYASGNPAKGYCFCSTGKEQTLHLPPGTYDIDLGTVRKTKVEDFEIKEGKITKLSAIYDSKTGLEKIAIAEEDTLKRPYGRIEENLPGRQPKPDGVEFIRGQKLSPDGKSLVFAGFYGRERDKKPVRAVPTSDIWFMNVNGTGLKKLTGNEASSDPDWSPDGKQIVYISDDSVWIMDADGGRKSLLKKEYLPKEPVMEYDYTAYEKPQWSPNGEFIAFLGTNGGSGWVVVMSVRDKKILYKSPPETCYFKWTRDNDLFFGGEGGTDLKKISAKELKEKEAYYNNLEQDCEKKWDERDGEGCCHASVERMRASSGSKLAPAGSGCPKGTRLEMLKCISSYKWCEPER